MQKAKLLQQYTSEPQTTSVSIFISPQWVAIHAITGFHVYYSPT